MLFADTVSCSRRFHLLTTLLEKKFVLISEARVVLLNFMPGPLVLVSFACIKTCKVPWNVIELLTPLQPENKYSLHIYFRDFFQLTLQFQASEGTVEMSLKLTANFAVQSL